MARFGEVDFFKEICEGQNAARLKREDISATHKKFTESEVVYKRLKEVSNSDRFIGSAFLMARGEFEIYKRWRWRYFEYSLPKRNEKILDRLLAYGRTLPRQREVLAEADLVCLELCRCKNTTYRKAKTVLFAYYVSKVKSVLNHYPREELCLGR